MTPPPSTPRAADRLARHTARCLSPPVLPVAAGCAVSWHAGRPGYAGLVWGGAAAVCGVVGVAVMALGVRCGWWSDLEVSRRAERPLPLTCASAAAAVVWLACLRAGAPRDVLVPGALAPAGGAAFVLCTRFGKVSLHTCAAAGSVALLTLRVDPVCALLAPLPVVVGWARIRLGAHTTAQVWAGGLLGAGLTAAVLLIAG
ncbi:phosphatase PAP2 family protein [Streptomyces sp. NPDC049555]|uniref:phosphatase PAP2 family protein n=1 Tax=unclassified Streptomyces TaxID=2593676 RepID=UPI003445B325